MVRVTGDAAILRYVALIRFASTPTMRVWHTDYYEKRGGAWQAVWSHATRILE
jgi:hypothetical protein